MLISTDLVKLKEIMVLVMPYLQLDVHRNHIIERNFLFQVNGKTKLSICVDTYGAPALHYHHEPDEFGDVYEHQVIATRGIRVYRSYLAKHDDTYVYEIDANGEHKYKLQNDDKHISYNLTPASIDDNAMEESLFQYLLVAEQMPVVSMEMCFVSELLLNTFPKNPYSALYLSSFLLHLGIPYYENSGNWLNGYRIDEVLTILKNADIVEVQDDLQ